MGKIFFHLSIYGMHACVYVCTCAYTQVCMHVLIEAETDGGCFSEAGSLLMNPELAGFGSLVSQFALGIPCLCHLSSVPTGLHHAFLAFIWALGIQILVLTLGCYEL